MNHPPSAATGIDLAPASPLRKGPSRHFEALDGLRGVAAIVVLIGHATALIDGATLFGMKLIAVWFFFMLSGFVVASAYEDRLNAGMSLRRFALARIIRLHPLLVLGALFGTVWFVLGAGTMSLGIRSIIAFVAAMAGLPSVKVTFDWSRFPVNPPEWSLFFELAMYAGFALFLRRFSTRMLAALVTLGLVIFAVSEYHWNQSAVPMRWLTSGVIASFGIGMLLHRWNAQGLLPRIKVPFWFLALAICVLAAVPVSFAFIAGPLAIAVAMPLVLIAGISAGAGKGSIFQRWLGDISYPLYILHWPILLAFAAKARNFGPLQVPLACLTAVGVAWVTLRLYDIPVRRWLSTQFFKR